MKKAALFYTLLVGLCNPLFAGEVPTVNVPPSLRQDNWPGRGGKGSCAHAALISMFNWQGRYSTATYWRQHYSGGELISTLCDKLDQEHIRYAATHGEYDVAFLEWSVDTRRGAVVFIPVDEKSRHAVSLVHMTDSVVGLLDDNDNSRIYWAPRDLFLKAWRMAGSDALAILYTPLPPLP